MGPMTYQPRVVDRLVQQALDISGAVLIEGVRACGKTATGTHQAASVVRLDVDDEARALGQVQPTLLLPGETPRLIDEWQLVPQLWNHVRRAVDDRQQPGQFILTGSATPPDDVTRHSGAGRILRLRLRPMTLFETGHSSGEVSLAALLAGESVPTASSELSVEQLATRIAAGGWPGLRSRTPEATQQILRSYLDDVARVDIQEADNSAARRDPARIRRLLTSYARHTSTPASTATIAADTAGAGGPQIHPDTVSAYLGILQRLMVVEEQPSWGPHLRSKDIVRQGPIRHFVDPSLALAALDGSPARLLKDLETFGLLFESLAIRDLRVYSQTIDAEIRHYRDSSGLEADAVIQLRDGRWAPVEIKLGAAQVDVAANTVSKLVAKVDKASGEPAARIVITGGQYAYTRPDGVHVVPLGCLGP